LSAYGDVDDLARAINALLADPARRRRMGEAGRQKVLDRYTWDVVTRQLRDLYCRLVTTRPQVPGT
jgi:glycosyltransferase involved in cell wall biosynthesis